MKSPEIIDEMKTLLRFLLYHVSNKVDNLRNLANGERFEWKELYENQVNLIKNELTPETNLTYFESSRSVRIQRN